MQSKLAVVKRYFRFLFDLKSTQEDEELTYNEVKEGIVFKGKNLWLLAIAIVISCIGLNINSKSAVIGAMIISPLMGPIFGIAFSLGISDADLLKLSFRNALRIIIISLIFSTLYYLITPYSIPTDELLSFSKPTIFDVLLAFAGGIAGFIAISRHNGTQVLIGVAVATSCIPPLCTAGFGLATWQWQYLVGGLYTYLINALFICVGAYIIVRFLKFHKQSDAIVKNAHSWFGILTVITILPAIYLAYELASENVFKSKAQFFVNSEIDSKYHVVDTNIDSELQLIEVDITVENYDESLQKNIEKKLNDFKLQNAKIKVYQTIEAGNHNRNEFDSLRKEIEALKQQVKSDK
ncbi:MAG: DUF389 domain-containing protein [Flavobacteriales bacterium]|nr:DUF389 domain-containing protein [Flavobacteriales bacterium]